MSVSDNAAEGVNYRRKRKRSIHSRKVGVAVAFLIVGTVLSGLALPSLKSFPPRITLGGRPLFERMISPLLSVNAASDAIVSEPATKIKPFEITVGAHESLREISVQYLGGYDPLRLHQIEALNPTLKDPNHIELGHKLWLPEQTVIPVTRSITSSTGAEILRATQSPTLSTVTANTIGNHLNARNATFEVTVQPDQKLWDVCMQHLGNFDLQLLHQVEALNPKLTDPDHIDEGQKLRLPRTPAEQPTQDVTPVGNARIANEP